MITRVRFEALADKKTIVQDELLLESSMLRSREGGEWEIHEEFLDAKGGQVWGRHTITKKKEGEDAGSD